MTRPPETHYATSGEVQIAYQVFGVGPELIWVPGWVSQLDLYWEEPALVRFLRRLATFARVIVFDRRGLGLSDRVSPGSVPTLDQRMDDIRAVLDDVGVQRAAVLAQGFGSPIALLFAATHPERTASLVLYSPAAKGGLRAIDYPWGATAGQQEAWVERSTRMWVRVSCCRVGLRASPRRRQATSEPSNGRLAFSVRQEARPRRVLSPR